MTPVQLLAAALRELLAPTPDHHQAATYVADIPTEDIPAADALVALAGMVASREAVTV